jgi:hypothetical protein
MSHPCAYIRARIPVAIPRARRRFPSRACGEKSSSRSRATDDNLSSRSRADRAPYSIAISCSTPGSVIAHPVRGLVLAASRSRRRSWPAGAVLGNDHIVDADRRTGAWHFLLNRPASSNAIRCTRHFDVPCTYGQLK